MKQHEAPEHTEVHPVHTPQGHGYLDQKFHKGMRAPIASAIPTVGQPDYGYVPTTPMAQYGDTDASS